MAARSRPRWLLRFGLLIGSLLFVLLCAEAVIRILIHQRAKAVAAESVNPAPELPVLNGMFELGRKNVRGTHKGVLFRTNSQRIRGPEYPRQVGDEVFRIAIAGDSVTMGEGVEESLAYPARLAERIASLTPGRRIEVINVGLSGSNTNFAMDRLEAASEFYDPDLIIYGFTINDIEGPHYKAPTRKTEELRELQSNRFFTDSPLIAIRLIWWFLVASEVPGSGQRNWYAEELIHNYFENDSAIEDWERGLDRFQRLARERGICAQVLIHTHLNELDGEHPYRSIYDLVQAESEERGLPVTPTFDIFAGADPLALRLNFIDPHPNPEGHAMLADALAEGLSSLPAACWTRGRDEG